MSSLAPDFRIHRIQEETERRPLRLVCLAEYGGLHETLMQTPRAFMHSALNAEETPSNDTA